MLLGPATYPGGASARGGGQLMPPMKRAIYGCQVCTEFASFVLSLCGVCVACCWFAARLCCRLVRVSAICSFHDAYMWARFRSLRHRACHPAADLGPAAAGAGLSRGRDRPAAAAHGSLQHSARRSYVTCSICAASFCMLPCDILLSLPVLRHVSYLFFSLAHVPSRRCCQTP